MQLEVFLVFLLKQSVFVGFVNWLDLIFQSLGNEVPKKQKTQRTIEIEKLRYNFLA